MRPIIIASNFGQRSQRGTESQDGTGCACFGQRNIQTVSAEKMPATYECFLFVRASWAVSFSSLSVGCRVEIQQQRTLPV